MTEAPITEEEIEAHPAVIKARVKLVEAETRKANAIADKEENTAKESGLRLKNAKADRIQKKIYLKEAKLRWARTQRQEKLDAASSRYHPLLNFNQRVDGVTASIAMNQLTEWHRVDPTQDMEIVFISPGGSIYSGLALYDFIEGLTRRGGGTHHITTRTLGMAASMAGVLLQSGDRRVMGRNARILIHQAALLAMGTTEDLQEQVQETKRLENRIINIFEERTNGLLTGPVIRKKWKGKFDWWIESEEALSLGLVDEVR